MPWPTLRVGSQPDDGSQLRQSSPVRRPRVVLTGACVAIRPCGGHGVARHVADLPDSGVARVSARRFQVGSPPCLAMSECSLGRHVPGQSIQVLGERIVVLRASLPLLRRDYISRADNAGRQVATTCIEALSASPSIRPETRSASGLLVALVAMTDRALL